MLGLLFFIFVISFFFAKVEIQIEGTEGWAKNLPTWRIENHWALKVFFGGRALTGYHFWVLTFIFILFHMPYFFAASWSWLMEARVLGAFTLFWLFEDFIWFVVNPGYGIKKFNAKHIPWHPRWILGLPIDYWIYFPVGAYLLYISFQ